MPELLPWPVNRLACLYSLFGPLNPFPYATTVFITHESTCVAFRLGLLQRHLTACPVKFRCHRAFKALSDLALTYLLKPFVATLPQHWLHYSVNHGFSVATHSLPSRALNRCCTLPGSPCILGTHVISSRKPCLASHAGLGNQKGVEKHKSNLRGLCCVGFNPLIILLRHVSEGKWSGAQHVAFTN